jgi:hypothetical protein
MYKMHIYQHSFAMPGTNSESCGRRSLEDRKTERFQERIELKRWTFLWTLILIFFRIYLHKTKTKLNSKMSPLLGDPFCNNLLLRRCVDAGVIMRRWITFCGVAPCTVMSGSSFCLSSRLRIVLFVFAICWLFGSGVISEYVFHFCLR